jgi:hypothetical protein
MAAASPLNRPIPHLSLFDLPDLRGWPHWRAALLAVSMLGLLPVSAITVGEVVERLASAGTTEKTVELATREWPARVVPVEWRWSPAGVDVDRMFRQRR